jgi:AcrR family transcriptional regulator
MVTATRRERQRREVRQGILDAARAIAGQDGWQMVTIRRIADRIEYSPPVIYEHFAGKDAILLELVREGFRRLLGDLETARAEAAGPDDALRGLALAYWRFAWDAPDLYQVMYGLGGVPFDVAATWEEGWRIGRAAMPVVAAIHPAGDPPPDAAEVEARVLAFWASLHGLVALSMAGRIAGGRNGAIGLVERAACDAVAAWAGRRPAIHGGTP